LTNTSVFDGALDLDISKSRMCQRRDLASFWTFWKI